jgi:hypothetical protein
MLAGILPGFPVHRGGVDVVRPGHVRPYRLRRSPHRGQSIALLCLPMLVEESRDLALQFSCATQLTHGDGVIKEFMLDICGQIIPLHDDGRPQAPQNMLLFLGEARQRIAILLRCPLGSAAFVVPPGDGPIVI